MRELYCKKYLHTILISINNQFLLIQVAAPARAGAIAPCDVIVEAQNTGMGPEKTSFFQALNISTKIAKGSIEIVVCICLLFRKIVCIVI